MNSWSFLFGLIIGFAVSWGGFELAQQRAKRQGRAS